jgi:hypothetical protein
MSAPILVSGADRQAAAVVAINVPINIDTAVKIDR